MPIASPPSPWRKLTLWQAMHLSDVATPILCSHALHGKESVMACRSRLFLFHGTSLLASHAVSSSLLTSCCRRKSSHQVLRIFLLGLASKRSDRHLCPQFSSVMKSFRLKTSFSCAVGCSHEGLHTVAYHGFLPMSAYLGVQFCAHVCMYPTLHDLRTNSCVNVPSSPPSFGFDSAAGLFQFCLGIQFRI